MSPVSCTQLRIRVLDGLGLGLDRWRGFEAHCCDDRFDHFLRI